MTRDNFRVLYRQKINEIIFYIGVKRDDSDFARAVWQKSSEAWERNQNYFQI